MNEEILDKIQKLLNMTVANGASLNEAANAAKIAQKLLLEHQLTVADLSNDKASKEKIHDDSFLFEGQRVIHWKASLAVAVCKVNGCKVYTKHVTHTRLRYAVIGRDSDIEICKYFYDYLSNEIERLCKQAMACGYGTGKTWSNCYKQSAVKAVTENLYDAQKEVRAANTGTTAMVKVDMKAEEVELWAKQNLKLKSQKSYYRVDNDARTLGYQAGKKISLSKGIGGKTIELLK